MILYSLLEKHVQHYSFTNSILGDSIDYNYSKNGFIAGLYSTENQLHEIDFRKYDPKISTVINWECSYNNDDFSQKYNGYVFSVSQSPNKPYFVVGCSRNNHLRIYKDSAYNAKSIINKETHNDINKNDNNIKETTSKYELVSHSLLTNKSIFSTQFSESGKYISYCGGKSSLSLLKFG